MKLNKSEKIMEFLVHYSPIIVLLGLLVFLYLLQERFDESKHICIFNSQDGCVEWQTKPKCELNPEDCYCLEYEYNLSWWLNVTYWVADIGNHKGIMSYEIGHLNETAITVNTARYYTYPSNAKYNAGAIDLSSFPIELVLFNITKKTCIKYREKTECDKNNSDYILEPVYEEKFTYVPDKNVTIDIHGYHLIYPTKTAEFILNEFCAEYKNTTRIIYNAELITEKNITFCVKQYGIKKVKETILKFYNCRKKTDKEKFISKLEKYECNKLLLDFTEDCLNCKYNYYDEDDEKLRDYFILKNCEVK